MVCFTKVKTFFTIDIMFSGRLRSSRFKVDLQLARGFIGLVIFSVVPCGNMLYVPVLRSSASRAMGKENGEESTENQMVDRFYMVVMERGGLGGEDLSPTIYNITEHINPSPPITNPVEYI